MNIKQTQNSHYKNIRTTIYKEDLCLGYAACWNNSGVVTYLDPIKERLDNLANNLRPFDPYKDGITSQEYYASIQMLAYTTTELLAQFCAGGLFWGKSDKARFLSPTVDVYKIISQQTERGILPEFYNILMTGIQDFFQVSKYTDAWFEAINLSKEEVAYLLFASREALKLLHMEERIPDFTVLALKETNVLDGFCRCNSPIGSMLYMQLTVMGIRVPIIQPQFKIGSYLVDFAIPDAGIVIQCDGDQYYNVNNTSRELDEYLEKHEWTVIHFRATDIMRSLDNIVNMISNYFPIPGYAPPRKI